MVFWPRLGGVVCNKLGNHSTTLVNEMQRLKITLVCIDQEQKGHKLFKRACACFCNLLSLFCFQEKSVT